MRRSIGLVTSALLVAALALPASGDIDRNPNGFAFGPGECSNGERLEVAIAPSDSSPFAKEFVADGVRGVAKALYVTLGDGTAVATVWERPGKGLDGLTIR